MLRARLWYGPAGQDVALDRVARYLSGPLACTTRPTQRRHRDGWVAQIELRGPLCAAVEQIRAPHVGAEAELLARRLHPAAPGALAKRLVACTARLEVHDLPGAAPFLPATGTARSVLLPLAYAMDGYVEEVETGRLFYYPKPGDRRRTAPMRFALAALGRLIRR
ncbi:hypothetical protein [Rhodovulum adriaticum]|uniref:Uncharacterized protein n=1 Tax=Rhodovulum adriaticum TaxID=35804 RepID=A0A4R2NUV3_RHOAD|nr:hypothetical protein [Rhodovulum adriaticum]MBK1635025.1 hypothetical protein [Rhodovulum adriaticum]TCP25341.1 hypothetical protein EV656_10390 [Rhodovulum adriaticum]